MIIIKQAFIESNSGFTRIVAPIVKDGENFELWFEVDEQYGRFLCYERSDAFVLGLLHYAIQHGHDIVAEFPMTDQLHFQLTQQLLPTLYKFNPPEQKDGFYPARIECPVAPPVLWRHKKLAVGAGLSCGVDSLHVFSEYKDSPLVVTHACVFKYHGYRVGETQEEIEQAFEDLVKRAQSFCKDICCELIVCNTNYDRNCFPELYYDRCSTHAVLFGAYMLQKLFGVYHLASGYDMGDFYIDGGKYADPAHYDPLIAAAVSTEGMAIYLDGMYKNRTEKVMDLTRYEPSKRYLNVCWNVLPDHANCSHCCPKCMRTMLNLDVCGALEEYNMVFDVDYYHDNFECYLAELYRMILQRISFGLEMHAFFKAKKIPLVTKIKAWKIVFKKAILKLMRRWKNSQIFVEK